MTTTLAALDEGFLAQIGATVDGFEFTIGDLRKAFDRVAPQRNWKGAIAAVVLVSENDEQRELALLRAAVEFMTGSKAELEALEPPAGGLIRYRVTAAGYYAAVGA